MSSVITESSVENIEKAMDKPIIKEPIIKRNLQFIEDQKRLVEHA